MIVNHSGRSYSPLRYVSFPILSIVCYLPQVRQVIDEISPRSRDSIIGFGERLGCKVMTAILRDRVSLPVSTFWLGLDGPIAEYRC